MKKLLIFIFLNFSFLIVNSFAQAYDWYIINPQSIPGTPDFSDVYFVNDNEGWITSSSIAAIYHTTDGGVTFEVQTTLYTCNAIHMLNENEGYAGGASGFIYKTTNGGANWNFYGTMGTTLADISFPSIGETGYCCGINGNIWSIDSTGVTKMTSNINGNLYSISFPVNSEEGWVCGGSIILTYANGIWGGAPNNYPSGGYNAIHMVDTLNGWAVGDGGIIIHTGDGHNWFEQTNPNPEQNTFYKVFFLNAQEGWAVGSSWLIEHTSNGGEDWTIQHIGNLYEPPFTGIHFTSPTNGYATGVGKTLLKYGEITSVENEEELPTEFSLSQNYPNPFNPSTKINWQSPVGSWQTLKVYDILGNEVAILVDEYKPAGSYEVKFQSSVGSRQLASGIYFYR